MYRNSAKSDIIYTPEDLILYRESPFASWMERLTLENPDHGIAPDDSSERPCPRAFDSCAHLRSERLDWQEFVSGTRTGEQPATVETSTDLATALKQQGMDVVTVGKHLGERERRAATEAAMQRGAEYICVFNDDIEATDPRWLAHAVRLAENDPKLGIVGFLEVNPPDSVSIPQQVTAVDVDYLDGFAMLIRRSLFESIGMFDEVYKGASDEDDLEARALRAGYHMKQVSTPIFHHAGGTRKQYRLRSGYLQMRDGIRFSVKNRGVVRAAMRVGRILDVACNPWPLFFDPDDKAHQRMRYGSNRIVNLMACMCAVGWNVLHLPQTLAARHREQMP